MDGAVRLAGLLVRSGSLDAIETILDKDGVKDIVPEFERSKELNASGRSGRSLKRNRAPMSSRAILLAYFVEVGEAMTLGMVAACWQYLRRS